MTRQGDKSSAQVKKGTRAAPKFTHLPAQRAKKLKEEWIAKMKIKNAYKAQKRRGDLPARATASSGPEPASDDEPSQEDLAEAGPSQPSRPSSSTKHSQSSRPPNPASSSSSRSKQSPSINTRPPHRPSAPTSSAQKQPRSVHPARQNRKSKQAVPIASDEPEDKAARARELAKEAYSPSSLHTFKSDPLKRRGPNHQRGRGGSGPVRGSGGTAGRGRGQPDMRKRMGALLAQIEARQ